MASRMRFSSISPRSLKPLTALAPTLACALGLSLLTVTTASAAPAAPTVTAATAAETSVDLTWSLPPVSAKKMVSVSPSSTHTCAVDDAGAAWCVGSDGYGQLGDGDRGDQAEVLSAVVTSQTFSTIESGSLFTCALNTAGAPYCWGVHSAERLGIASATDPTGVVSAVDGGHSFTRLSNLELHTCALTAAGAAYCWGSGGDGRMGDGSTGSNASPGPVSGGHTFNRIAAGERHSCAIDTANDAWCWGFRGRGVLGVGGALSGIETTPVAVSGGLKFTEIDTGGVNTCALTAAGAAYCWGANNNGELGSGSASVSDSGVPVAVAGSHTFTQITLGDRHVCALDNAGAAWCWGMGTRVGNGTTDLNTDFNVPTQVSGGHVFKSINASMVGTCAIDNSDRIWCWGAGIKGALDTGTSIEYVPTRLLDPGDPDDYQVETSTDGTTWTTASASTGGPELTYSVTGLTAGTAYYFRVTGSSGGTLGTASAAYGPVTTTGGSSDGVPTPVPMLPLGGLLGVGLLVAGLGGRRLRQAWRR